MNRLTYMSLRHWFIAKHKLPFDYQFHDYIMRCIHSDFSQTMGVRWWMWVLLMINVLSDGYDIGNIVIPTSTVILSLVVGTKLHAIAQDLTRKCFDLHDHNDNKKLDKKELDIMHTVSDGRAATFAQAYINDKLFWFEKPWVMLVCIQCVMFQNALELVRLRLLLVASPKILWHTHPVLCNPATGHGGLLCVASGDARLLF